MEVDEKLAELVGILLGDGSIGIYKTEKCNQHVVKVTFHSEHLEYIEYVSDLFLQIFGKPGYKYFKKNEKACDLKILGEKYVDLIISIGMKLSPKWNRAIIPKQFMNKHLRKYVLRGYFDTDGSVVICNNNGTIYPRLEMKISPSPMQNQFKELLDLYGFKYGCYDIGKGKVRIQMNGHEALEKWKFLIGFSNDYYLQRYLRISKK